MTLADKTPVSVLGGYLGSGKTTLVNHLLRNANGKRIAILVNEFGELPIDADLIEAQDDDIISLSGGCVCCSYGNDLIMAMMDMAKMEPRPDHIVLEASGVALPGAIAGSLSLLNDFQMDGIIVIADAETVKERATDKYMGDTITRQLSDADIVLLNKTDLVSDEARMTTNKWLAGSAPHAVVVETQRCKVPASLILQSFDHAEMAFDTSASHETNTFKTERISGTEPVEPETWIKTLLAENPNLIRSKGFVRAKDGSLRTIQSVGKRYEIGPAPDGAKPGFVLIKTV